MAINVTRTSANLDKTQQYFLTLAPNVKKMTDKSGEVIAVDAFCIYEDTSVTKSGEEKTQTILSIKTPDNNVYGTNSMTFIKSFVDMMDFFNDDVKYILVDCGTSKNGREFIQCVFVPENSPLLND